MKKFYVIMLGVLLFGGCEKAQDYIKLIPLLK